jgi:amino acid transporter
MTAVLIIPLAFSNAGQGTWLAYLFGTAMLLFVVFNLNQFARRSTSPGSMYAYTGRGLGAVGGVLSGWTLIWSYLFIGVAGMTGSPSSHGNSLTSSACTPPFQLSSSSRSARCSAGRWP